MPQHAKPANRAVRWRVNMLNQVPLVLMLVSVVECATPTSSATLAAGLQQEQRLLETVCVRQLMDQGISLMHHAEAVTNHCRQKAKLAVR
jgi:hypothetical protein